MIETHWFDEDAVGLLVGGCGPVVGIAVVGVQVGLSVLFLQGQGR